MNATNTHNDYDSRYNLRRICATTILLLSFFQVIVRVYIISTQGGHNWGTGEWLINYSGGFVRRGMIGSLLFLVSQDQPYVLFVLFAVQASLITVVYAFFLYCLNKFRFTWASIALFCSPFSITFIGWDQYVFARKELIGLVTLILIASIKLFGIKRKIFPVGFALILYTIGVFSSEVNLVFISAVVYLLSLVYLEESVSRFWICTSLFLFATLCAFFTSVFFTGDRNQATEMCKKVIDSGLSANQNCRGSIRMMGESPDVFFSLILSAFPHYLFYLFILLFALLPILSTGWHKQNSQWFFAILICTGSLFVLALDYGRNVFIVVSALTICLATSIRCLSQKWNPWIVIFYVACVGMGHGGNPISNGWIAAIPSTMRFVQQHFLH